MCSARAPHANPAHDAAPTTRTPSSATPRGSGSPPKNAPRTARFVELASASRAPRERSGVTARCRRLAPRMARAGFPARRAAGPRPRASPPPVAAAAAPTASSSAMGTRRLSAVARRGNGSIKPSVPARTHVACREPVSSATRSKATGGAAAARTRPSFAVRTAAGKMTLFARARRQCAAAKPGAAPASRILLAASPTRRSAASQAAG